MHKVSVIWASPRKREAENLYDMLQVGIQPKSFADDGYQYRHAHRDPYLCLRHDLANAINNLVRSYI